MLDLKNGTVLDATKTREGDEMAALRSRLVPELRDLLEKGRAEAERRLYRPDGGVACARAIAALTDQLVTTAYEAVERQMGFRKAQSDELAVIATGGYGGARWRRARMSTSCSCCPTSHSPRGRESVVEAMLYVLWDLKLKVGHATRTVDECLREARADMTIRTSLLEARFLFGDEPCSRISPTRFDTEIVVKGTAAEFVDAKLKERDARVANAPAPRATSSSRTSRRARAGCATSTRCSGSPSTSIASASTAELVAGRPVHAGGVRSSFARCEEFLWRVRCHLHFATGRAEERLTFDVQRQIAERARLSADARRPLGRRAVHEGLFPGRQGRRRPDRHRLRRRWRRATPSTAPVLDRLFGRFAPPARAISKRRISWSTTTASTSRGRRRVRARSGQPDPAVLARRPAQPRRSIPTPRGWPRGRCRLIGAALRDDPEANRLFLDILTSRNAPEVVLRRMNEAGVLGRFIPDFGRIVAMMQFNMYHHYTVDEHLIALDRRARRHRGAAASADEHPLANRDLRHRSATGTALYVGAVPARHRQGPAGGSFARRRRDRPQARPAPRPRPRPRPNGGLAGRAPSADVEHGAEARPLRSARRSRRFAATSCRRMERLKLLLVLTVADIKAVGPGVWTGWKGQLLRTLYYETEVVLGGGHSADRRARSGSAWRRRAARGAARLVATRSSRPTRRATTRPTG